MKKKNINQSCVYTVMISTFVLFASVWMMPDNFDEGYTYNDLLKTISTGSIMIMSSVFIVGAAIVYVINNKEDIK